MRSLQATSYIVNVCLFYVFHGAQPLTLLRMDVREPHCIHVSANLQGISSLVRLKVVYPASELFFAC